MPAGFASMLRYLHLQICAFQGEEMRIKKSVRSILGGPKTGSKLEPQHVGGKDTGFGEDVCLFGLRAKCPVPPTAGSSVLG